MREHERFFCWCSIIVIASLIFSVSGNLCHLWFVLTDAAVSTSGRVSTSKPLDIKASLHKRCSEACLPQLKLDEICTQFCEFVDHIYDEHGQDMIATLKSIADEHDFVTYETAIQWAMDETVRFRRNTYSEDVHLLGDLFMTSVKNWHQRLTHDEL